MTSIILETITGTKHEFNREYINYWQRIKELSEIADESNIIQVFDIEDKYIVKIIEFLDMYHNPTNKFGIHRPLRNKKLGVNRGLEVTTPDLECRPCLIESGVPKMYVDYMTTIEVDDIIPFYKVVFDAHIVMLYNLVGAYIAYCLTNVDYDKIVLDECEIYGKNDLADFTKKSRDEKASIRKFLIDNVGKREFIYDEKFPPFNLEEEKALTKNPTYVRFAQVEPDYEKMYLERNPPKVPLTPEQIAERRFLNIPNTEYIPGFNTLNYLTQNYVSKKPDYDGPVLGRLNFNPESADEMKALTDIVKPFVEDKFFGTVEDDDARSYTEYNEEGKDETTFDKDLYQDFLRRKETRFRVREFLINNRKTNNRRIGYNFMIEQIKARDKAYRESREYQICELYKHCDEPKLIMNPDSDAIYETSLAAAGGARDDLDFDTSEDETVYNTDTDYTDSSSESEYDEDEDEDAEKPPRVHRPPKPRTVISRNVPGNPFRFNLDDKHKTVMLYMPQDVHDPAEDGYAEPSIYSRVEAKDLYTGALLEDELPHVAAEPAPYVGAGCPVGSG
jgi:hypothetical protein